MVLSGGNNGRIAISSWMSGITVRVITDHGESSISCIDVGTVCVRSLLGNCPPCFHLDVIKINYTSSDSNTRCVQNIHTHVYHIGFLIVITLVCQKFFTLQLLIF